ncbi:MAG: AAA family ATPase [Elusimicrobia bacterium]|nr:AAA family ATPase [Elusimicrobiota bacterium]
MTADSLIIRHRPKKLKQVVGHDEVVSSFQTALDDRTSHGFLFTGPSGVGKTTFAYCGAKYVGAVPANTIDRDAASFSGKDDMSSLVALLKYKPLGRNGVKAVILDEVHRLSPQAWDSGLKILEQPPEWVYFFLCTTDIAKVPNAILTRCTKYSLKPVSTTVLFDYLLDIVEKEGFDTSRPIIELCVKRAEGSPRQALSNLAACYAARDREEAASLISQSEGSTAGSAYDLAKALAEGKTWTAVQKLLKSLHEEGTNPESIRQTVRAYFTTIVIGATDEKVACRALAVLDHFSDPCNPADGMTPVVTAVGRALFAG